MLVGAALLAGILTVLFGSRTLPPFLLAAAGSAIGRTVWFSLLVKCTATKA